MLRASRITLALDWGKECFDSGWKTSGRLRGISLSALFGYAALFFLLHFLLSLLPSWVLRYGKAVSSPIRLDHSQFDWGWKRGWIAIRLGVDSFSFPTGTLFSTNIRLRGIWLGSARGATAASLGICTRGVGTAGDGGRQSSSADPIRLPIPSHQRSCPIVLNSTKFGNSRFYSLLLTLLPDNFHCLPTILPQNFHCTLRLTKEKKGSNADESEFGLKRPVFLSANEVIEEN